MKSWSEMTIPERIDAITRVYPDTTGDCRDIGKALGTSKAAIAGFYNRNPERLAHVPLRGKMRLNTEKELQRKRGGIKEPVPPLPPPEPVNVFEPSNPVTLLEIEDTGCRYVVDVRRGGESLMCNETATRKFGFCPYHSKLNYEPR
ncbi:hypothetical protein Ab1vBOLIVR4_gp17c [Agrobacterium phage OLIVR4]|nr:hypothetical protein Ab1vBOLIVR4_gp17c [Agrobacterium phage OLIVR4]